jgi:hypothetical protein
MPELTLSGAIARFITNESRLDEFLDDLVALNTTIAGKANQAFVQDVLDLVNTKASEGALQSENTARETMDAEISLTVTQNREFLESEFATEISRPGNTDLGYTNNPLGLTGVAPGVATTNTRGVTRRITGTATLSTRRRFPVIGGLNWNVTVILERAENPSIISGAIVRVAIRWLAANGDVISTVYPWPIPFTETFLEADGLAIIKFSVGAADGSDYQPPVGAADFTINVLTYDTDGQTDVDILDVTQRDISLLSLISGLQTVAIDSLVVNTPVAELGTSFAPELDWTITGTGTVTAQRINGSATGLTAASRSSTRASISADTTYTLEVDDAQGHTVSADVSVDFRHRVFWGGAASAPANSAAVLALGNSELATDRARTKTLALVDQYPVIAYPTSFGSHVQITGNGFVLSGGVVSTVSVTTAAGFTGNYYVVRWPEKITGTVTIGIS